MLSTAFTVCYKLLNITALFAIMACEVGCFNWVYVRWHWERGLWRAADIASSDAEYIHDGFVRSFAVDIDCACDSQTHTTVPLWSHYGPLASPLCPTTALAARPPAPLSRLCQGLARLTLIISRILLTRIIRCSIRPIWPLLEPHGFINVFV